jgi:hypothetical protein
VTAIELNVELAARTIANFAQTPHVHAVHGDGTRIMFEPADVIYVNVGATDGFPEPRRAARDGVPDRASRPGISCAPDLRGGDFSV